MSSGGRRAGPAGGGDKLSRVRVAVRVRPVAPKTGKGGADAIPARCVVEDIDPEGAAPPEVHFSHDSVCKSFAFDHVFPSAATQEDVYASSLRPFLSPFLNGFNVTVIAYGQTGAGKTFTVGHHASLSPCPSPETPRSAEKAVSASPEDGLIPRFLIDLFESLRSEPSVKTINVSFLEIYCDEIHDLLSNARATGSTGHGRSSIGGKSGVTKERPLMIRDDEHRVVVHNLTQIQVETAAKALELMNIGRARQATGSNALNSQSSRSHAIYTVEVSRKFARDIKNAKLTFVDLAGSERLQKTNVQGMCMKESIQINVGLLALSTVINALREDRLQKRRQSMDSSGMNGDTVSFVPYRSSKLTRLLRDALGGNSMSLFIACVSPTISNSSETLCTLQFADRVSCIENKAQKNVKAVCTSGSSSPQRVSSPRSAAASPRNSMRGRSASEIEINRLQEQILMLKHQLDMATAGAEELPVHCTTYEPVAPAPAPLPPTGFKLTPPRATELSKTSVQREPEPITSEIAGRKASTQGSRASARPRSASISEVRNEKDASDGKATGVKPSMLVRPRIRLSDRSPPRDASNGSAAVSSAKAPAKPHQPSVAFKLFIERMNASASARPAMLEPCVKAQLSELSESRSQEDASGCVDQQTANDCNGTAHQTAEDNSSDIAKSPTQDQPQSIESEVTITSQKSPTLLPQPPIQAFHGRRQSSPSALAIPSVSTKLKSFMESIKQPIRLPSRERSDSLSSSSSRSPRSSPSSPSSASTSSVSPMSARRQSLVPTSGTANSALSAFMEKVKPNGYANSWGALNPSSHLCEDEGSEPEQVEVRGEACDSSEPELSLELKDEPTADNAETSVANEGQLEQESSLRRSYNARKEETADDKLLGNDSEEAPRDDGAVPVSIVPAEALTSEPTQDQTNEPETQQTLKELGSEDPPDEPDIVDFRAPTTLHEDVSRLDAVTSPEDPATCNLLQDDANDEQQYVIMAVTADVRSSRDASLPHGVHDVSDTPPDSSEFDTKLVESPVGSVETRQSICSVCIQGYDFTPIAPSGSTVTFASADESLVPPPRYYGPIYPADPLDFEEPRLLTIDQSTQCDEEQHGRSPEREHAVAIGKPLVPPSDFIVDPRHWRDAVRQHFTGAQRQVAVSRRQKARSGRPHPFKWFDFPGSNQKTEDVDNDHGDNNCTDDDGDATPVAQARRLQLLLGEVQQLVRAEIGHSQHPAYAYGRWASNNNDGNDGNDNEGEAEDDDVTATTSVIAFLDGMTRLLNQRAQCQQRVDTLKRQLRRLSQLLGPLPTSKQPICLSNASVSVDMVPRMADEELGRFTLGHQEALLRAALDDCESHTIDRLQLRLLHFQQAAAVVSSPPPEVFLTHDQYAACQSARGRELLPLVLTGWVSVAHADIDAEHAWLSL